MVISACRIALKPHLRLGLEWLLPVTSISPKDSQWKLLEEIEGGIRRRRALTG
jgi:hypothetical protein